MLWPLLAIALIWSCGKDDDPAPPPAAPTIANFSPTSGPVGTVITINGTNFSTTNASNTVKVGTATATVSAATATKITATVPQGATTGKVSVTVGTQTATSTNDFTVTVPDVDDPDGDDPANEAPTADEQSFEVAEDIAVGDVIGTATATDADEDELTFALVTDESERFLVADNGEISLAEGNSLDFETTAEYSLTLSVNDGTNEPVEFRP
ncbi:IPT/TIG domain-containing protein [Flagellimonas marinaquae]